MDMTHIFNQNRRNHVESSLSGRHLLDLGLCCNSRKQNTSEHNLAFIAQDIDYHDRYDIDFFQTIDWITQWTGSSMDHVLASRLFAARGLCSHKFKITDGNIIELTPEKLRMSPYFLMGLVIGRYFSKTLAEHCIIFCAQLQYIPRNMHTVFALLCFVVVIHWLIFPYPSGLLHWHCGNLTIAPVPAKQPWWIWINSSCEFIMNDCITTTKQSTTKRCAYFLGYTVHAILLHFYGIRFILYPMVYLRPCHLNLYSISQEICTRFCCALFCCGYAIVHNEFTSSIYLYSSGLLCWHWGNR